MQKRYAVKNFLFVFLFFSVLELLCFFSAMSGKNIASISEFGGTPQSMLQTSFALFYNLLYLFILAFVAQFLVDQYNRRFFKNILNRWRQLIFWGLSARLLVNFLYFLLNQIPFQYYSLKHGLEFLMEICFDIFVCTIALYIPVKKQKPMLRLKQIAQGKKHIFLVLTAGILLLIMLRSFAYHSIFTYYNGQVDKYISPDISYLHNSMEYQDKLINLLSLTAVDILSFLCIFYIVNQQYRSYQEIIIPKRNKFSGIIMMVILYNVVWTAAAALILFFAFIFPKTMPYQYQFGPSASSSQPNGFFYSKSQFTVQKNSAESAQTMVDLAHIQIGYQTTKSVTKKVDGFDFLTDEAEVSVLKDFWIHPDSDSISMYDNKDSLKKLNISGFSAYRFGTGALAYIDGKGNPQIITAGELNDRKYDKNLTTVIEAAVNEGYFDFLEYSSDYLKKYDAAFLTSILERYAGNQLNSNEKECNKQTKLNYMMEFAKRTLG